MTEKMQTYIIELRRGSLTLAVLGCLKEPRYGYALLQLMQAKGIAMEANTLYPLLRRLESQGLLSSEWDIGESRPRKYYRISEEGRQLFTRLWREWIKMRQCLEVICGEEGLI